MMGHGNRGLHRPTRQQHILPALLLAGLCAPAAVAAGLAQPAIGAVSAYTNVFADAPATYALAETIDLTAARRERQCAQIAVVAGAEPVAVEAVDVADLAGPRGVRLRAKECVQVHLVGYARVEQSSWRGVKRTGLWPDPLLPLRAFECPPGEARSLWVTVAVPARAAAGSYRSAIALRGGGRVLARIPLVLRVLDFALPEAPRLQSSYWTNLESQYDLAREPRALDRMIALFGEYRTSTNLWYGDPVKWYRQADGRITCDAEGMKRNLAKAAAAGFRTLQVGTGCWAMAAFDGPVIDRATGKPLPKEERAKIPSTTLAKLYLNRMCDWLQGKGWLDRAYIQLYDECSEPATWPGILSYYHTYRELEPRLRLLGLIGIHPSTQGVFDIWSPHTSFYDAETYDRVRRGVSLYAPKRIKAAVTASSTGGWGNAAFYKYQPVDAYDGCEYTKWVPSEAPSAGKPQWLRFDLEAAEAVDGIRISPYGEAAPGAAWTLEASEDGREFQPLRLEKREGAPGPGLSYTFAVGRYKAFRLVWTRLESGFKPSDLQPVAPPESLAAGVREVELLSRGAPPEAAGERAKVRPAELWEYNVGADYPSVCVDADPVEIRATGWRCWERGVVGYLNYGGGYWDMESPKVMRPKDEDPLVWRLSSNGSPMITYPGKDDVLASIRFARFRDGLQDYDLLMLLQEQRPKHPLLQRLRGEGQGAYGNVATLLANRAAVVKALSERRQQRPAGPSGPRAGG